MFKIIFVLSLTIFITSCGSVTRVVVLQNPETKQTVECRIDPWGSVNRTAQIEDCITAYKKAGYKVVGDSD
jgi:hypothetical protein